MSGLHWLSYWFFLLVIRVITVTFWDELHHIHLTNNGVWLLLFAVVLMPINWGIEAKKWQLVMQPLKPFTLWEALKSVLAGISTGIITPNRIGNFIGRTYRLEKAIKTKATLLTFLTNLAQFVVTVVAGIIGLMFFGVEQFNFNPIWTFLIGAILLCIAVYIYFSPKVIYIASLKKWYPIKIKEGIDHVQETGQQRKINVLLLSGIRYVVFVSQFACALLALDDTFYAIDLIAPITVIYLIMTITPFSIFWKTIGSRRCRITCVGDTWHSLTYCHCNRFHHLVNQFGYPFFNRWKFVIFGKMMLATLLLLFTIQLVIAIVLGIGKWKTDLKRVFKTNNLVEKSLSRISIVIPFHNERLRIGPLIKFLNGVELPNNVEVIFVDDHSVDDTSGFIHAHLKAPFTILNNELEKGKKQAILTGVLSSKSDYILTWDADNLPSKDYFKNLIRLPTADLFILPVQDGR